MVGVLAALSLVGDSFGGWSFPWPLAIIGLVIAAIAAAVRPKPHPGPLPGSGWLPPGTTGTVPGARTGHQPAYPGYEPGPPPVAVDTRRRGPMLFWFTMGLALVGVVLVATFDLAGWDAPISAYPAAVLAACGVMLLVGAFYGRAGGLIFIGLLAALATLAATAVQDLSAGQVDAKPTTAAAVEDQYEIGAGEIILDLTEPVEAGELEKLDGRTIEADARFGHILVLVPQSGLDVDVNSHIEGAGESVLFGEQTRRLARDGPPGWRRRARRSTWTSRSSSARSRSGRRRQRDDRAPIETPLEERTKAATGWHSVNVGHLVMGTAFVGLRHGLGADQLRHRRARRRPLAAAAPLADRRRGGARRDRAPQRRTAERQDVRVDLISLPGLTSLPATDHPELVAPRVAAALAAWPAASGVAVVEIDPDLADTAAMSAAYDLPLDTGVNCVLIAGKREGEERIAACLVRADTRADVNHTVKRLLDVRKPSFLPMERAVTESEMEYGGITPVGLPSTWRLLIDPAGARRRRGRDRLRRPPLQAAPPRSAAGRPARRRGDRGSGRLSR